MRVGGVFCILVTVTFNTEPTMPTPTRLPPETRRRFNAAMAYLNQGKLAWCAVNDITKQHLDFVLKGQRDCSPRLEKLIDAEISKHEKAMRKYLQQTA